MVRRQDGPVFVCATKKAEDVLAPILPGVARSRPLRRGARHQRLGRMPDGGTVGVSRYRLSGSRRWRARSPSTDREPFQAFGCYVRQTRGRRMRSGEVRPVEVEVHPDPRCQELLEQIREAEIVRGRRPGAADLQRASIVLLNELALDVTMTGS